MTTPCNDDIIKAPPETTVCWCSKVSKGTILKAMKEGARTLDDIRRLTGASTIGRCQELSPRKR